MRSPLVACAAPAQFFAGLDWAAAVHAVCVMDHTGKIVDHFTVRHSAERIAMLIRRLARLADAPDVQVGIERPNGRLVDLLLQAGHPVVPVSPNAIKTWRDGEVLSGAKSDAGDAMIAEYLRLRQHRLRIVVPYSDDTRALRTMVRTRTDLVDMRVAATNQLSALHVGEKRMQAFMTKHGYSGRKPAAVLLERLRAAPAGTTSEALTGALRDAVLALVTVLKALNTAVKDLDRSSAAHLGEHPDGKIFTSLPRSGQINAAQILAEWGDVRQA